MVIYRISYSKRNIYSLGWVLKISKEEYTIYNKISLVLYQNENYSFYFILRAKDTSNKRYNYFSENYK